jgi:hypothetical protein
MVKVTRVTPKRPPGRSTVAVATGAADIEKKVPEGTSTDAVAALVGRYNSKKKRHGGKGCCPGSRGY